jgi:hypothetical protein
MECACIKSMMLISYFMNAMLLHVQSDWSLQSRRCPSHDRAGLCNEGDCTLIQDIQLVYLECSKS